MKTIEIYAKKTIRYAKIVKISDEEYEKLQGGEIDEEEVVELGFATLEDDTDKLGVCEFDYAVIGEDGVPIINWDKI